MKQNSEEKVMVAGQTNLNKKFQITKFVYKGETTFRGQVRSESSSHFETLVEFKDFHETFAWFSDVLFRGISY